jgi:hypothetical protein
MTVNHHESVLTCRDARAELPGFYEFMVTGQPILKINQSILVMGGGE